MLRIKAILALAAWLALCSIACRADTLEQGLIGAYQQSPELEAARARLRRVDEGLDLARTGYFPSIRADLVSARRRIAAKFEDGTTSGNTLTSPSILGTSSSSGLSNPLAYQVSIEQPVFDGFKTRSAVERATAQIGAGEQSLLAAEIRVLNAAVKAHIEVVRDQQIVALREQYVEALRKERASISRRLKAQETTNADRAQTDARLARAEGELAVAQANLRIARARYVDAVGLEPSHLATPKPLYASLLPPTLEAALDLARQSNPDLGTAQFNQDVARHAIDEARAELLPQVSVSATWNEADDPSEGTLYSSEGILFGRVSVPILEQGGASHVRVRMARHEHDATIDDVRKITSSVETNTRAAWLTLEGARARAATSRREVDFQTQALAGIRREASIAGRTQSDVLNAEQDLLSAKVTETAARYDVDLAAYALLAAIGHLTLKDFGIDEAIVDPAVPSGEADSTVVGMAVPAQPETSLPPVIVDRSSPVAPVAELRLDRSQEPETAPARKAKSPASPQLKKNSQTAKATPQLKDSFAGRAEIRLVSDY